MDVYYDPEHFGLTQIDCLDTAGSYQFDMVVVWKHEDGSHYLGTDSGCSCPSPFEWANSLADLTRFDIHSIQVVEDALKNADASYSDTKEFLDKVKASLKGVS